MYDYFNYSYVPASETSLEVADTMNLKISSELLMVRNLRDLLFVFKIISNKEVGCIYKQLFSYHQTVSLIQPQKFNLSVFYNYRFSRNCMTIICRSFVSEN